MEEKEKVEYRGKEYEVKYLQEQKYGRRGEHAVAYIDLENGFQLIAKAERSKKDQYSIEQAKIVVLGRLKKKIARRKRQEIAAAGRLKQKIKKRKEKEIAELGRLKKKIADREKKIAKHAEKGN